MDRTINQRIKKQRHARLREGWQEVRVWVPTREDAEEVLKFAASLRAKALGLIGLEKLKGIEMMTSDTFARTIEAVAAQGGGAYITESGPVLELLSEMAQEGHIADMAAAFVIFARAYPLNAPFVAGAIPAKILSRHITGHAGISPADFLRWESSHSDWGDRLRANLRDPKLFECEINEMIAGIRGATSQH